MDELTRYIFHNYDRLLTPAEKKASFAAMTTIRLATGDIPFAEIEEDPEVRRLALLGKKDFERGVVERIMREHAELVVLNRCPDCKRLVATPRAKQCLHCGWDWHDPEHPVRRASKR